ncbi:MAG TPA: heme-binding domain-containing protein [Pyrinomonadaceae bacterium]|nr:heme-binding domain-containing protein [Pyrinomonadaceae bacterium]
MRKVIKIGLVVLVLVLAGAQFIRPTFSNPPIVPGQSIDEVMDVPAEVNAILERSCSDCHSNRTNYPWYSYITPVNWFLADHIRHGREELNFSEWSSYSVNRRNKKLEEICEEVTGGSMPLPSYLWIHRDAQLDVHQKAILCDWARAAGSLDGGVPNEPER